MAYFVNLFSPDTYNAFSQSDQCISGFRDNQASYASNISPGDKFICYMTKLSRWIGVLEVTESHFIDDTPIFMKPIDPFVVRFKVKPIVWLKPEYCIPINDKICWDHLSFTKSLPLKSQKWTGIVRGSLRKLNDVDGKYLEEILLKQKANPKGFSLSEIDTKKIKPALVKTKNSQVVVSIPDEADNLMQEDLHPISQRESIKMQALLAHIGERMNLKVWLPRNDRQKVIEIWKPRNQACILEQLPLNYDDVTLRTIENIDVLWIQGRSIIRAFEVKHTTSIYSGILRMADLMALQPNLSIKAHIVAPEDRKAKVFQEITRPVFALLESGPLAEACTYLSYNSVRELSKEKKLEYMNDRVLEEYMEYAQDADL